MIAMLRLWVLGFLVLVAAYFLMSIYTRSTERERLEKLWIEEGGTTDRGTYVEEGMRRYATSWKRRANLLIFVIPPLVVAVTTYIVNAQ